MKTKKEFLNKFSMFFCGVILLGCFFVVGIQRVEAAPELSITPNASLNFGDIGIGRDHVMDFMVENTGDALLSGAASTVGSPIYTILNDTNFDLSPGEKKLITANFSPQAESSYWGKFEITSNGGNISSWLGGTGIVLGQSEDSIAYGAEYKYPEGYRNGHLVVSIDESHALIVYKIDSTYNIYGNIVTISGTNHISYGERFLVDNNCSNEGMSLVALDPDTILFIYDPVLPIDWSRRVKVIDNINPITDTVSVGNYISIDGKRNEDDYFILQPQIVPLIENKAAIVYGVNYANTSGIYIGEAFVVTTNNAVITKGPEFVFDGYTNWSAGDGDIVRLVASSLDDEKFFVLYETFTFNDDRIIVGSVNGTNISFGPIKVLGPCTNRVSCWGSIGNTTILGNDESLLWNMYRRCGNYWCTEFTYRLWKVKFSGTNFLATTVDTQVFEDSNLMAKTYGFQVSDIDSSHVLFLTSTDDGRFHKIVRVEDSTVNYGRSYGSPYSSINTYTAHNKLDESRVFVVGYRRIYSGYYTALQVLSLETFDYPTVTNDGGITNIIHESATLRGEMTDLGGAEYATVKLYWGESDGGTSPAAWDHVIEAGTSSLGVFSSDAIGLNKNTTYYYRTHADIGSGLEDWADETVSFDTSSFASCQDHNVWGWAYSENVGWMSFSCKNKDTGLNYGVDICTSEAIDPVSCSGKPEGTLVGYAWSRGTDADVGGVGWISFNESDLSGCPSGDCRAWIDTDDGKVYGWARALAGGTSQSGGWDGWIKLSGTAVDGSSYGLSVDSGGEFQGWAWGDDVMGWVSFNCDNPESVCSHDYKVETSFSFNSPPQAENLQIIYHSCCGQAKETCKIGFDWVYRDGGGGNQIKFEFQVDDNAGFSSPSGINGVNRTITGLNYPDGTHNSQEVSVVDPAVSDKLTFRGTSNTKYYWRVKVYDASGNDSGWIEPFLKSFQTELHAWPWPDFELIPDHPAVEEIASTTNSSKCFNNSQEEIECNISAWLWTIADGSFLKGTTAGDKEPIVQFSKEPIVQFSKAGDNTLTLDVSDALGTCSKEKTFKIILPLPIWIETSPR